VRVNDNIARNNKKLSYRRETAR